METQKLIGKSSVIRKIKNFIKKAASVDYPVLISGETGVGKEMVARKIHELSKRKEKLFIPINCANIPENLFESELFGYRKGAFTDAKADKIGLIEQANRGTMLFDEISELSLNLQAKFLRLIEFNELRRLGDIKIKKLDVRFIFCTNTDLKKEVSFKRFREDLYYRINVLHLYIPPLRERREDIPLLIDGILERESKENGSYKRITPDALDKFMEYEFPGNVRELESIIKRAFIFSYGDKIKEKDVLFEEEPTNRRKKQIITPKQIKQTLENCEGNKTKAAKEIGKSRRQLYRLIEKFGMSHLINKKLS